MRLILIILGAIFFAMGLIGLESEVINNPVSAYASLGIGAFMCILSLFQRD